MSKEANSKYCQFLSAIPVQKALRYIPQMDVPDWNNIRKWSSSLNHHTVVSYRALDQELIEEAFAKYLLQNDRSGVKNY